MKSSDYPNETDSNFLSYLPPPQKNPKDCQFIIQQPQQLDRGLGIL